MFNLVLEFFLLISVVFIISSISLALSKSVIDDAFGKGTFERYLNKYFYKFIQFICNIIKKWAQFIQITIVDAETIFWDKKGE